MYIKLIFSIIVEYYQYLTRDMNTSLESKISVLNDTLKQIFEKDFHLARIKFIGLFISALCKVQTVSFEKLAVAFDSEVDTGSSL